MAQIFDTEFLDPTLPDVSLKIGGKVRKLAFDYRAMCLAEQLAKVNLLQGVFDADFTTLGALLYAALLHHDEKITLDEVGAWIHYRNAPVIYDAIKTAWLGSLPKPGEVEPGEAQAQAEPAA